MGYLKNGEKSHQQNSLIEIRFLIFINYLLVHRTERFERLANVTEMSAPVLDIICCCQNSLKFPARCFFNVSV